MISLTAKSAADLPAHLPLFLGRTPCGIRKGYGSFLFFEFAPSLQSDAAQIWIFCCHWQIHRFIPPETVDEHHPTSGHMIFRPSPPLVHSEDSDADIEDGLKVFEGASFDRLTLLHGTGQSIFSFSNGTSLLTWPYDDETDGKRSEQWMISEHGRNFKYRSDGLVACVQDDEIPEDVHWMSFDTLRRKSGTS